MDRMGERFILAVQEHRPVQPRTNRVPEHEYENLNNYGGL